MRIIEHLPHMRDLGKFAMPEKFESIKFQMPFVASLEAERKLLDLTQSGEISGLSISHTVGKAYREIEFSTRKSALEILQKI